MRVRVKHATPVLIASAEGISSRPCSHNSATLRIIAKSAKAAKKSPAVCDPYPEKSSTQQLVAEAILRSSPRFVISVWERLCTSPIAYRLARGAFWSLAGTVISRGLSLIASIFVARILGSEQFGEVGIIRSTVEMIGVLAGFGLGLTATKHVAEFRKMDPERTGRVIALAGQFALASGLITAVMLCVLSSWMAKVVLAAPHLDGSLRVASLLLLFHTLNGSQVGALVGFEAFRAVARTSLLGGLSSFPLLLAGAYVAGPVGVIWGLVLSLAVQWALNRHAVRSEGARFGVPWQPTGAWQEWPMLWRFSLPAALSTAVVGPVDWICGAMLVNQPGGYAEMGVLSAAYQLRSILMFLPSLLMQAALPVMAETAAGRRNGAEFSCCVYATHSATILAGIPLATLLMFLAGPISALYGPHFNVENSVFVGASAVTMAQLAGAGLGPAIQAQGRVWLGLTINACWGVILLLSVSTTVARFGAGSLAYSAAISYGIVGLGAAFYLARDLPAGVVRRMLATLLLAATTTVICLLLPSPMRLAAAVPAATISLLISLFFLSAPGIPSLLLRPIKR